jgi:hypothetical protein
MRKQLKKIGLIAVFTCILIANSFAQEGETKRFTVGAGFGSEPEYFFSMQHLKFDYNITPKISVGLKNNMRYWDKSNTQQGWATWRNTIYSTTSLVGTYYLLGTNQNDSKWNVSLFGGFSLNHDIYKYEYDLTNTDPNALLATKETTTYSYGRLYTGIGGNYKVGPGKIFLEIPVNFELYFTSRYKTSFNDGDIVKSDLEVRTLSEESATNNYLHNFVGFQFGYQINF